MKNIYKIIFALFIMLVLFSACTDNPAKPDYRQEVNVFGYLWANQPMTKDKAILISYTQPIDQFYDLTQAGIRNAEVTITAASTDSVYELHSVNSKPGFYFSEGFIPQNNETYMLKAIVDDKVVTAETTIPPMYEFETELSPTEINTIDQRNWGFNYPIVVKGDRQDQVFMVDVYCNEEWQNARYINSFHDRDTPGDAEEYDGGRNAEPRHIQAILTYKDMYWPEQDVNAIYWYSSMIQFYGWSSMMVLACDDNYHRYIMSEHPELSGGVENGIGLFGSVSGQVYELNVVDFSE